jgi:peptidoglycan/LPS O-acetylase OafA/YrhL
MAAMTDASGQRVLGWDVLRGLAALAVAVYHLLYWQGIAGVHTFGSYGVYLFFVLSGASLAYTYAGRLGQGRLSYGRFLWVRYMRLAPLYIALMLVVIGWGLSLGGEWSPWRYALNASFLFGFFDPAVSALLIGGWSLGIEAIFYLAFPMLLMACLASRWLGWVILLLLAAMQAAWIARTAGAPTGYEANLVAYHQAPAFAAYFRAGGLMGLARRRGRVPAWPKTVLLPALAAGFVLLWALNPVRDGDQLIGWRGAACAAVCILMAWLAGGLSLEHRDARVAAHLGDATYGLYLMHPVLYFAIAWAALPKLHLAPPEKWALVPQLALMGGVIAAAFVLALLSERYFERPLRDWSKSRASPPR